MTNDRDLIHVAGSHRIFNRIKVLGVLMLALSMSLMAVSSINVALPAIELSIGASNAQIQWILAGYALSFGIVLVPAGRLGDVLGRGSLWIAGVLIFTGFSAACAFAATPTELIIYRLMQGVGAGIFLPQTTGMIQQYFSGIGRARAYSFFGMAVSASVAFGPVASGTIIKIFGPEMGWRGSFMMYMPFGVLGVLLSLAYFPFDQELARKRKRAFARVADSHADAGHQVRLDLDPIGMALLMAAVLLVMVPFMSSASAWVWLLIPFGILSGVFWVWWEKHYKNLGNEPMVDMSLFKYPTFSLGTATSSVQFLGSTCIFAIIAIYLQSGLGVPAFQAGFIGLPNAIVSMAASYWVGRRILNRGRYLAIMALLLIGLGPALCAGLAFGIHYYAWSHWWLMLPLAITGFGQGVMGSVNQTLTMIEIPAKDGGTAGGIQQTALRITTAVGTAMITAVLFSLVDVGWRFALLGAYSTIAGILLVSAGIAVADLKVNGPGAPELKAATRGRRPGAGNKPGKSELQVPSA